MASGLIATVLVVTSAGEVLRGTEAPGAPSLIDAPGPPVVPDWDYDAFTGHVGSECVLSQKNRTANNSRFAFWYVLLLPQPRPRRVSPWAPQSGHVYRGHLARPYGSTAFYIFIAHSYRRSFCLL